ncbi:MAG: protease, partial [Gemmataceae bacterium]|nr:protease [Gemmataceae bacterium]
NGPTMFRRAVRFAVDLKVDVILFSGTFEGAGNYDGRGPIDAAVDEAVAAGIIWVNAAGNGGGMVYNGPADVGPDGFARFRGTPLPTALRFTNRFDENAVTVTLTWNDYRDAEDAGTDKDLDLIVEDAAGRVVGESKLTQVPAGRPAGEGESKNPRERLVLTDLPAVAAGQEYRIRVKAKANNFGPRDRIRVLLSAAKTSPYADPETGKQVFPVEFLDASKGGEVYPPADHPGVLTVGDSSRFSAAGPTADGRVKPDVVLEPSVARFSNGEESVGSSNAAAYFAGVVVALRAKEPGLTAGHVREWVRRLDQLAASTPPVAPPLPSAFPPGLPPPSSPDYSVFTAGPRGVFLSPNQQRALRYAENSFEDNRRQKGLPPYIVMSTPGATYLVQPGGRLTPGDGPPTALAPAPLVKARAQAPADPVDIPVVDRKPPHSVWITPAPKALADLVRGP